MALLLDVLHTVEFLSDLREEDLVRFMVKGRARDFDRYHVFWNFGDAAEHVVIPVSGEAKSSISNPDGREFIERFYVSGECAGLVSAIDGLPCPADAAVTRSGEFFSMNVDAFQSFLDEYPKAREKATRMTAASYRRVLREREQGAMNPTTRRIAGFLLRHACMRQSDGARILLHATQADIAASVGTVREVVSRLLVEFEQRGILERDERGITVADWKQLCAEAGFDAHSDEGRAAAASREHTARFFLPTAERRRRHLETDDVRDCAEHVGDLSYCRKLGCPGAIEEAKRRR